MVDVDGCYFNKISNFYSAQGFENYNSIFSLTGSIELYNSIFNSNTMGIINLHPFYYSSRSLLGATYSQYYKNYNRYAYIENSTFINNVFDSENGYSSPGTGLLINDDYNTFNGFIKNCTFEKNIGRIVIANNIADSSFFENIGFGYSINSLVKAKSINNSFFKDNVNQHVYADGYVGEGIASADVIINSTFINNTAAFGGAVANTKLIRYSVFVNNTAKYKGNAVYSSSDDVDYSTNWWGDNQKPDSDDIFIFLGNLKLDDWIIMTFESVSMDVVKASLNTVRDDAGNFRQLDFSIPIRPVYFTISGGNITPDKTYLSKNEAYANISFDLSSEDFKAYAKIDNQLLDVDVRNTNTRILMNDVVVKGNNNKFDIDLVNINGHKISNQTLSVKIIGENNKTQIFDVLCDDGGHATFNIDFPVGKYDVVVSYFGNGYFEKCDATSKIEVLVSKTNVTSYNNTYYGKNNLFYGILKDENGEKLVNFTVLFKITDLNGETRTISTKTDYYGRAEVKLSLDAGEYDVCVEFEGNSWYGRSSSISHIIVKAVNSTIIAPNVTFYGEGNVYNITLKDVYGNIISGENILVILSAGNSSDKFILTTDENGVAKLTINYLPGEYNVKIDYVGDEIYGSASANSSITVEKVITVVSGFHHCKIPLNGIYTVVLSDMYGRRINNESI